MRARLSERRMRPLRQRIARRVRVAGLALACLLGGAMRHAAADPAGVPWVVKGPSGSIAVSPDAFEIPLSIVGGQKKIGDVRVTSVDLLEQSLHNPLATQLDVGVKASDGKFCPVELEPSKSTSALLHASGNGSIARSGHYKGLVIVSGVAHTLVGDKDELTPISEPVAVDIYVSTDARRYGGAGAIFLGVLLAFAVNLLGRQRYNRSLLLLPVAALRERLESLRRTLQRAAPSGAPKTLAALREQLQKLDIATLEDKGWIPRLVSPPWSVPSAAAQNGLQQYLDAVETSYQQIQAIVHGMLEANAYAAADPAQAALAQTALASLDVLSADLATQDLNATKTKVDGCLQPLRTAQARGGARAADSPPGTERLTLQLVRISIASWLLLVLVTTAVGIYILIGNNAGFGIWTDYFVCFFWGLGLPAGASALQALTAQTVAGGLGFSVPKAS